ncbi:MAG: enoyl-CoA hydratase, partial [Chloroflexi bacterium]|nr:enoyl-CoA hydratase [Chloroflexota bacterium]
DGPCTGGGATIAACCDLRIASATARFGYPIARTLGNCLSFKDYARLAALFGIDAVKDLVFTARLMHADELLRRGFVREVSTSAAELYASAESLAQTVAGHAPLTLQATKEALLRVRDRMVPDGPDEMLQRCWTSEDFREGIQAFLDKRPPVWQGR